ncbi:kanadaptin-like [Canis lupus familiaris]|uniref:kanadaptin-like n=1 Tax=Canis lupus familiaris TaxID=9615 RepID=UPI0018F40451|nr:kanadaptin-like [Canis lupus familiaris]
MTSRNQPCRCPPVVRGKAPATSPANPEELRRVPGAPFGCPRYHAVLQHRAAGLEGECDGQGPGFYLYDLGSTHGTFLNKTRIPPRTYRRVHVGHVLRFGGSTRLFLLQGPEEDREAESELTVTQLKELRKQQQMMLEKKMLGEDSDEEEVDTTERKRNTSSQDDEMGCTWGMEVPA